MDVKKIYTVKRDRKFKISILLDWIFSMLIYGALFMLISKIFKHTIYLDYSFYGLWSFLLAITIYVLNKVIKPIIVYYTWSITGITMGLFYPFINVIILNIADLILGSHFNIHGIFMTCFIGILLGFLTMLLDKVLLEPLFRRDR